MKSRHILYSVLAAILAILLIAYAVFYFTNPKKIENAVQAPFTPDNLDMSEYIDLIMEKGSFGDLEKDDVRVLRFAMNAHGIPDAFIVIDVLYQKNEKAYRQTFQFDGNEMTIEPAARIKNADAMNYQTTMYPSLHELESIMDTMDLDLLPKQPHTVLDIDYWGPSTSSQYASTVNGYQCENYIMTKDGLFLNSELAMNPDPYSYHCFQIMIDVYPYQIFFDKFEVETQTN